MKFTMMEEEINDDLEFEHKLWFLGEDRGDGVKLANKKGLKWRIVEIDNRACGVTDDFNPERLNFTIKDNVIIEVSYG